MKNCDNVCTVCKMEFGSREELMNHRISCFDSEGGVQGQQENRPGSITFILPPPEEKDETPLNEWHQCRKCGRSFGTLRGLRHHQTRMHKPEPQECAICHREFHNLAGLRGHVYWVHEMQGRAPSKPPLIPPVPECGECTISSEGEVVTRLLRELAEAQSKVAAIDQQIAELEAERRVLNEVLSRLSRVMK